MGRGVLLLLGLLLCSAAATLDVEERQKEERTRGSPRELVQETSGPPEDLVAEGISPSAINISWSSPDKEPSYYLVTAPPCMYNEEISYSLTYVITGLEPCDRCYVTVTSFYSDNSKFSADTVGDAEAGAPPQPESCSVVEVNKNFIKVQWAKPTTNCGLGPYDVIWTWHKLWGDGEEESDMSNTTGQYFTVHNPLPYHNYTFEITASVDGVFSSPTFCSGTSLESPAGPPVLLSVVSEEAGVAQVTWDSPAEENGEIIQYGIFVNDAADPTKNVSGEVHSTTVSLQECVVLNISVEALNHAGWGERSEAMDVMVFGDVLPQELHCPEPDPEVQVCWEPYSKSCPGSQYNLKWEGDVLWSDSTESNRTTLEWSENEICYNIPSTPYTLYTVALSVGTKLDETINCSTTTPMAAPGPPILEELQTDDLVINVTWKEPEEKNGIISGYQVKWTDWNGAELKSTDGDTFSLEIVESSCGGEVDVTVRAKTTDVEEFGEESPPRSVSLINSVSDLMCEPTMPGTIALSWEVEHSDCPIEEYNVTWTFVSLWSEDTGSGWVSVDGNDDSALVTSLPPYSSVTVEVLVDKALKNVSCTAVTLEQASSPPTEVHQIAKDANSVTVEWSLPESVRGELLGWHLNWTTSSDEYLGAHYISDPENMTFQISELLPSETYVVYVMAVNGAGAGEAEVENVITAGTSPSNSHLILEISVGCGVVLIFILACGVFVYKKKNKKKVPRSAPFMVPVTNSNKEKLLCNQHRSSAIQRFQGNSSTFDFGTNSELYPNNDETREAPEEVGVDDSVDDEITDVNSTTPGRERNLFGVPGARRLSQQLPRSVPSQGAFNRRPSQQVNIMMTTYDEHNRRSSMQDIAETSDLETQSQRSSHHEAAVILNVGEFRRRTSQQIDLGRPNLYEYRRRPSQQIGLGRPNVDEFGSRSSRQIDLGGPNVDELGRRSSQQIGLGRSSLNELGRRPSQQIDLERVNLKEFGRRPSQQIDVRRPNSMEYRRRPSQQIDQAIPRAVEYGRRSSQQVDLGRPNLREYRRRPSQQTDIGRPRSVEYARRPSQQVDIDAGALSSHSIQQPFPARPAYDHYMRRPSQQAMINIPDDRAFMRRPSQQFIMSFEGIQE